ncbi:MAG TPA: putative sulfate exporter family transporter [Steroidobacteraceae bacterium]|nr:putative sulfate exporter family transporter [Steroidobacteraceae bacterium]
MAEIAQTAHSRVIARRSPWGDLLRKEDWWAIWIGLGLIAVAVALFAGGSSIKWIAVAPQKWSHLSDVTLQLKQHGPQYAALFVLWSLSFGIGAAALGIKISRFLPAFLLIYLAAGSIYFLGLWDQAAHYNLEPPLVALGLGLLVSNTLGVPRWLDPGLRVEFYIKTGIVLLGASLPLTLIAWAGPVAIVQAAIVSLATFGVIYFAAVRLGLDRRLAATLGTGGAVCGVSGAIAVGGAVGARKEEVSAAISLVVFWAIVMIFVLPLVARALNLSTGVAGAWIGTSEFADAAGLAAAQTYGGYAGNVPGIAGNPDAAVSAFTLMKVIGRDMWIGVWAFVLSLIATARWERTAIQSKSRAAEIWNRFPKFVLGFIVASAVVTLVARGFDYAVYKKEVVPALVAPLQAFRTWAFTFAFLSIGLTTRIREFASIGARPFYAFTIGVLVNVVLGFVLSTQVFNEFWNRLGQ